MKAEYQYLKFVRWEEDRSYVGHCPDLFPWDGVCHTAAQRKETYRHLCALVRGTVEELRVAGKDLPEAATRAMREAVPA
jgi:hypothetical protein